MPSTSFPLPLSTVNAMDRDEFVRALGGIFENSPWVAEAAWRGAPFADVAALHAAMVAVVRSSPADRQLALLQAHPDLAGKAARAGAMTAHSWLGLKFATWQNNGILPANNEFHSAEQRINKRKSAIGEKHRDGGRRTTELVADQPH
jgi:OHCU decarboxylase